MSQSPACPLSTHSAPARMRFLLLWVLAQKACPDISRFEGAHGAEASHAAGLLGRSALFSSDEMIQGDVLRTMLDLICSLRHKSQLAGLGVLAGLALTSPEAAKKLLSPKLHQVCPL